MYGSTERSSSKIERIKHERIIEICTQENRFYTSLLSGFGRSKDSEID